MVHALDGGGGERWLTPQSTGVEDSSLPRTQLLSWEDAFNVWFPENPGKNACICEVLRDRRELRDRSKNMVRP